MTVACTRCGNWHLCAERALGRNLSCTEVKRFWAGIKSDHCNRYDHPAQIMLDESGMPFCFTCKRPVDIENGRVST